MNKLYACLLLALLGPLRLLAQSADPTRAALDNLFAPLDKSQVPTGRLAESALPLVPLDVFNGTLTDSSRTTMDLLRYLRVQFATCRVAGPADTLPGLPAYNARLDAANASILSFG